MSHSVLKRVEKIIRDDPQSASALTLYALLNTLAFEKGGCLFKLTKLRDLTADERQLAYELMEFMALEHNRTEIFGSFKQAMDEVVRGA